MKLFKILSATTLIAGMFIFVNVNAENLPECNSPTPFCALDTEWGGGSTSECLEGKASTNCWNDGYHFYFYPGCFGYSCSAYRGAEEEVFESEIVEEAQTGCSGSGFCGWRDGVNKTGSSAVGNAARAKLHVCNSTGKSAESNWNSDNSACHDAEASYNDYCTTTVWEDLCDGYLPPVKK